MCRHAAYLGPPRPVAEALTGFPRSLQAQARTPRELLRGTRCADGFGAAWQGPAGMQRIAAARPLWEVAAPVPATTASSCFVAAVRDASEPGGGEDDCAPFVADGLAFSHNGYLDHFTARWRTAMRSRIPAPQLRKVRGRTDSEHLFAALRGSVAAGCGLEEATRRVVGEAQAEAQHLGEATQLNLLVTDGTTLVASRAGNQRASNSLYLLPGKGVWVASEPLFDGPWERVGDATLLVARLAGGEATVARSPL